MSRVPTDKARNVKFKSKHKDVKNKSAYQNMYNKADLYNTERMQIHRSVNAQG